MGTPAIRWRGLRLLIGLLPAALAVAWLPLRSHLPNTDLALVLVVAVAGVGFIADRPSVVVGALGAGLTFDLIHTSPYGELAIRSGKDVLTTAFLVVAGLVMGEVALRLGQYRRKAGAEAEGLALATDVAGFVASGGEAGLVVEAVATELASLLSLRTCTFEAGPPDGDVPFVGRDGTIVRLEGTAPIEQAGSLDLPIWTPGDIVGRFRMALAPGATLGATQLHLAIGIADQAGAALITQLPPPIDEPQSGGLRLVPD